MPLVGAEELCVLFHLVFSVYLILLYWLMSDTSFIVFYFD